MNSSIKPHLSELPPSLPNLRGRKTRSSTVSLSSQFTRDRISLISKSPISAASVEPHHKPRTQPLIDLLHDSADKGSVQQAKAVHGFAIKSNFSGKDLMVLLNHVAHAYCKCWEFDAARQVFNEMPERNIFSWTVMIVGSIENGFFLDGFRFFCEMLNHGIFPDNFAYSAILQTCIGLDCIELGKMAHAQVIVRGFAAHTIVSTSVLNMYSKLGMIEDSLKVFNTMAEYNEVSWNSMISGFTSNGLHLEAFNLFTQMRVEGFTPNVYTLIGVSKAVGQLGDLHKCREVKCSAAELGLESSVLLGTALIDMYSKCGSVCDARSIFDSNFSDCRANTPWNAMISGYYRCGCHQEALEIYIRMRQNDIQSDVYTYCSVFNATAALKCLKFGEAVHAMVLKSGNDMMVISILNAIADTYAKCGALHNVKRIFDRMVERDMVSWTTFVTAYSQCSEWEEALATFSKMREEGFTPNQFTYSSVLVSCASLCFLEYGQQVHGLLCKAGLETDRCTESSLIDMYAKCGSIAEAGKVFNRISDPDTVSFTAIISGYAQHGLFEEALEIFSRMEQLGMKPNAVTFLCVLFACSHAGMVDEGLFYFQLMEEKYALVPEMEHYACIVDLLGRVGHFDDAMEFVKSMPTEPNEMIWQTLLGACRVHGNVELGELAAQKILSVNPEYSATYVLLSNTYTETGNIRGGLSLRDRMRERGVRKEPGYSWISVEGRVHKFYAGDQNHPQKDDIYAKLEELEKIKSLDYVSDLSHVS